MNIVELCSTCWNYDKWCWVCYFICCWSIIHVFTSIISNDCFKCYLSAHVLLWYAAVAMHCYEQLLVSHHATHLRNSSNEDIIFLTPSKYHQITVRPMRELHCDTSWPIRGSLVVDVVDTELQSDVVTLFTSTHVHCTHCTLYTGHLVTDHWRLETREWGQYQVSTHHQSQHRSWEHRDNDVRDDDVDSKKGFPEPGQCDTGAGVECTVTGWAVSEWPELSRIPVLAQCTVTFFNKWHEWHEWHVTLS